MTDSRTAPAYSWLWLMMSAIILSTSTGCGSGSGGDVTSVVEKPNGLTKESQSDVPLGKVKKKP